MLLPRRSQHRFMNILTTRPSGEKTCNVVGSHEHRAVSLSTPFEMKFETGTLGQPPESRSARFEKTTESLGRYKAGLKVSHQNIIFHYSYLHLQSFNVPPLASIELESLDCN